MGIIILKVVLISMAFLFLTSPLYAQDAKINIRVTPPAASPAPSPNLPQAGTTQTLEQLQQQQAQQQQLQQLQIQQQQQQLLRQQSQSPATSNSNLSVPQASPPQVSPLLLPPSQQDCTVASMNCGQIQQNQPSQNQQMGL